MLPKPKNNRFFLPILLILMVIFIPLSTIGLYSKISDKDNGNKDHKHYLKGKIYYYDKQNKLIGLYECENKLCVDATGDIDDEYLNYFEGATEIEMLYNDEYALIRDGDIIKLHNVKTNITIAKFKLVKNYGTSIDGKYLIVKTDEDTYGLFNTSDINYKIPSIYNFMGINKKYINTDINSMRLAVKEAEEWFIVNGDGTKLSSGFASPIADYDDNYVYVKANDGYEIYTYQNERILASESIAKIDVIDNAVVFATKTGAVKIYSSDLKQNLKVFAQVGKTLSYELNEPDYSIEITDSGNIIDRYRYLNNENS